MQYTTNGGIVLSAIAAADPQVKQTLLLVGVAFVVMVIFIELIRRRASGDHGANAFGAMSGVQTGLFLLVFLVVFGLCKYIGATYGVFLPGTTTAFVVSAFALALYRKWKGRS